VKCLPDTTLHCKVASKLSQTLRKHGGITQTEIHAVIRRHKCDLLHVMFSDPYSDEFEDDCPL
jgi:hypothetical protein